MAKKIKKKKKRKNLNQKMVNPKIKIKKRNIRTRVEIKKMYFEDKEYKKFLEKIQELVEDKEKFKKIYCEVNKINIKSDNI